MTSSAVDVVAIPEDPAAVVAAAEDPEQAVLVMLDRAKAWLVGANNVTHINEVRARAEAIRVYTIQANLGRESEQAACEIRLRAERRAGELLRADPPKAHRPAKASVAPTLSDLGLSREESSDFQRLAAIPEPEFEEKVTDLRSEQRLSRAALLNEQKAKAAAEQAEQDEWVRTITPPDYDPTDDNRRQQISMAALRIINAAVDARKVETVEQWAADASGIRRLLPNLATDLEAAATTAAAFAAALHEGAK